MDEETLRAVTIGVPIIDIFLQVEDTTNEESYVPALEAAGYMLRVREPEWLEPTQKAETTTRQPNPNCPQGNGATYRTTRTRKPPW